LIRQIHATARALGWTSKRGHYGRYTSTDRTSATTKASSFDSVPNEVLDLIVSSIPLDGHYVRYKNDGSSRKVHQIIALMHVSRQFRFVMLQHKVWRKSNFNFNELVATASDRDYKQFYPTTTNSKVVPPLTNIRARTTRFCNLLFSNPYFREGIKNKTDWTFGSLEVLFSVIAYLPIFTEFAHTVILNLEALEVATPLLFQCNALVHLNVLARNQRNIVLDDIGRFLPSLKILKITLPAHFTGSLKGLGELEEFSLNASLPWFEKYIFDERLVLPIASAKTLTRMHLLGVVFRADASLKMFTSLKHLSTEGDPTDADLANLIYDLPVGLRSLASSVDTAEWMEGEPPHERYELVDCPCLAHLKKICLSVDCEPGYEGEILSNYIDDCMQLVTKMVDNMQLLEEVELYGGFDIERIHVLGQLPNLRRLEWIIRADLEWIVPEEQYEKCMGDQDLTSRVIEIFTRMGKEMESMTIKVEDLNC
jgi:hypothetical protein